MLLANATVDNGVALHFPAKENAVPLVALITKLLTDYGTHSAENANMSSPLMLAMDH